MDTNKTKRDRRRYDRVTLEVPVNVRKFSVTEPVRMRYSFCKNISKMGILIISYEFCAVNSRVFLQLVSLEHCCLFEGLGRIVWVEQLPYQQKYRIGIEFLELGEDAFKRINNLINNANGSNRLN